MTLWFGGPGLGKSVRVNAIGAMSFDMTSSIVAPVFVPIDDGAGKSEWQKRRDRSQAAKARLVAKLKKGGR